MTKKKMRIAIARKIRTLGVDFLTATKLSKLIVSELGDPMAFIEDGFIHYDMIDQFESTGIDTMSVLSPLSDDQYNTMTYVKLIKEMV